MIISQELPNGGRILRVHPRLADGSHQILGLLADFHVFMQLGVEQRVKGLHTQLGQREPRHFALRVLRRTELFDQPFHRNLRRRRSLQRLTGRGG